MAENIIPELAARCEAASGPDADLQYDIMTGPGGYRDVYSDRRMFDRGNDGYWSMDDADCETCRLPDPTTSVNAAFALAPEGCTTVLAMQDRHSLRWKWEVRDRFARKFSARAETAALALTAALLKASAAPEVERIATPLP